MNEKVINPLSPVVQPKEKSEIQSFKCAHHSIIYNSESLETIILYKTGELLDNQLELFFNF